MQLSQCYVSGYTLYDERVKQLNLAVFDNFSSFMNQGGRQKSLKYVNLFQKLSSFIFQNKCSLIYVQDVFTLVLALILKQLIFWRKVRVVYHQFEVLEPARMSSMDRFLLRIFNILQRKTDIIIVPEQNRLNYFATLTGLSNQVQTLIFPNTNSGFPGNETSSQPNNKFIIAHVGNVGLSHYIHSFMQAIGSVPAEKVEVWFVGRLAPEVLSEINGFDLPQVKIIGELPHYELKNIYSKIDLGVILYKDLDVNYRFCAPNKLYEYWASGIPVIGHAIPGLIPVFQFPFQGTLTNMDVPKIFGETLVSWINEPEMKTKRIALRSYFNEHLRIDSYLQLFDKLLKTKL